MKPFILIGHCNKTDEGAYDESVGSEYDFNLDIAFGMKDEIDIFTFDNFNKGYTQTIIQDMSPKTQDYDIGLELHFNSFSNEEANGVEALYWHTNMKGKKIAEKYCKLMHEEFGSIIRGAKPISSPTQRGYATFAYQKPTIVLLEAFFCTGSESTNFDEPQEKERYRNVLRKLLDYIEDEQMFDI